MTGFHAAPPPGEWLNDPNGLVFAGGRYRLFAQHSAAGPEFAAIGWARFSSDDLLHWEFDGPVIAPDDTGFAYSGSLRRLAGGDLAAYLTRHRVDGEPRQVQFRLVSRDHGLHWQQDALPVAAAGRNARDPFVSWCATTQDWRMLVAEPCDWADWQTTPPSRLTVWRDDGGWHQCGAIGDAPAGVLWEVPTLVDFGAMQALIVSTVDRRGGGARCGVQYQIGRFDGQRFAGGTAQLLDHGPDYYAAIPNLAAGWPDATPVVVAWGSSWATARRRILPGGGHGGAVALPRTLRLDGDRLRVAPITAALPLAAAVLPLGDGLVIDGDDRCLTVSLSAAGTLEVRRDADDPDECWFGSTPGAAPQGEAQTATVFIDGGLVELFLSPAGLAVTAYLPGATLSAA